MSVTKGINVLLARNYIHLEARIFLFSFKITVLLMMFAKEERGGMRSEMDERG